MFTINTYLDRSTIQGIGVFAAEDIAKGKVVWVFNPLLDIELNGAQWTELEQTISTQSFKVVQRYAYKENNKFYLCVDNAQFMNHSDDHFNVGNNKTDNTMAAKTAIRKGDELVCNYYEYCDPDDVNLLKIR